LDKLRAIKSFVRIVESGSLTAAAADLNVSLSSMVRMLAALEHDLGVTLLNRTLAGSISLMMGSSTSSIAG